MTSRNVRAPAVRLGLPRRAFYRRDFFAFFLAAFFGDFLTAFFVLDFFGDFFLAGFDDDVFFAADFFLPPKIASQFSAYFVVAPTRIVLMFQSSPNRQMETYRTYSCYRQTG